MAEENKDEIMKFDPSKLMDGVRDRIKATFVALIPDDQWELLCQKEMAAFFEKTPKHTDYSNRVTEWKDSEFSSIFREELRKHFRVYIEEFFKQPQYNVEVIWGKYNNANGQNENEIKLSDHLEGMVKEMAPTMMSAMFENFMKQLFFNFFNQAKHQMLGNGNGY